MLEGDIWSFGSLQAVIISISPLTFDSTPRCIQPLSPHQSICNWFSPLRLRLRRMKHSWSELNILKIKKRIPAHWLFCYNLCSLSSSGAKFQSVASLRWWWWWWPVHFSLILLFETPLVFYISIFIAFNRLYSLSKGNSHLMARWRWNWMKV